MRDLKRSGSSSSSSSRSSSSRTSYGNCYGDRCDNTGGSANVALIVGCIVGGCCFIGIVYYLVAYCMERRAKAAKKARRKKRNRVGASESSENSDMPREPYVVHDDPNSYGQVRFDDTSVDRTDMNTISNVQMI